VLRYQPDDSRDFKKSKQDVNMALDHIRAILVHQILLVVFLEPEECYIVYLVVSLKIVKPADMDAGFRKNNLLETKKLKSSGLEILERR
jgi:hypothetical protein